MTTWTSTDSLATLIPDGANLALVRDGCGVAMTVTQALVRRRIRDLRLVNVPTGGMQTDLLIGAGCVTDLETSGVSLGEYGPAGRFTHAVQRGAITLKEATCPAIHAGLQATEKGVPFLPLRGILGSDILRFRPDWQVIDNPLSKDAADPIVVIPAIAPDIALFHCPMADDAGNVWVGRERDLVTMAHASAQTLVTVERRYAGNLYNDPTLAAGTLSAFYITAVAESAEGCKPLGLPGHYGEDAEHLRAYALASRGDATFAAYLDQYLLHVETP